MPKHKSNKRKQGTAWSAADHAERQQKKRTSNQRTALLTHDTFDKRQQLKLKLHFTKTNRQLEQLKSRLEQWDPVVEKRKQQEEEEEEQKRKQLEQQQPKKKWVRPGPETWKLKGAARPAHLVYDFDTRYQCPHQKAHDDYKAQQARLQNLLQTPATDNDRAASVILRDYLSALMQCGHLQLEMGASPIQYWQECMELEQLHGLQLTTAQRDLLQWYMEQGDYSQAEQFLLQQQQQQHHSDVETDVWWVFSSAWLAVELKRPNVSELMIRAIQNNPFCAYYLAFFDTFDSVFEYQNELQEADEIPQSSLEEAIEFSTTAGELWRSNGADQILQRILVDALSKESSSAVLTRKDVEWKKRLQKIEEAYKKRNEDDNEEEEEQGPDISMYAEMFRTSMDMLKQAGKLPK